MPVASAQVKSCLLFAGLLAEGETTVRRAAAQPRPHRAHAARRRRRDRARDGDAVVGRGRPSGSRPGRIVVPADFSSAAFFLVAALLVPGSELRLAGAGLNPTRTGLLSILERMGADGRGRAGEGERGGEPIGDDRRPRLAAARDRGRRRRGAAGDRRAAAGRAAACFAEGETTIRGADELRHKESDRIATVVAACSALGAEVEASRGRMRIEGGTGGLRGGTIDAHGDHRIAMLGAVAGLASREGVEVAGMEAAAVSYPGFEADLGLALA